MTIDLDAGSTPPVGVVAPAVISTFVGVIPRQFLMFSGIADVEFDIDSGDLTSETVEISLGASTTAEFTSTASVALAAVSNDNTSLVMAADGATIVQTADGLKLVATIAAQGTTNVLRIAYKAEVLSDPIRTSITGTISWNARFGAPKGSPQFDVAAGTWTTIPSTTGGFSEQVFNRLALGESVPPVLTGDTWTASYEIDGAPLGIPLAVVPTLRTGAIATDPALHVTALFQPQQQQVTLLASLPELTGVDFVLDFEGPPR